MNDDQRLAGILFFATLLLSAGLMCVVVFAPWALSHSPRPHDVLLLFAEDMTVRRISFAASLGLLVTAFVFFRPAFLKRKKLIKDAPVNVAGA